MNSKRNIIFLIILVFISGCGVKGGEGSATAPTLSIVTATFPPSATPAPTYTPPPPPPTPTPAPIEGTASTQINVRSQPSTAGDVLGIVAAYAKVQIIGKDPGGNWYQILYPAGIDGKGWVTAQYVSIAGNKDVPVIGGSGPKQNNGNVAIIQQKLNVRSGPGTDFNSLGTLNPQDVVNLIGKDSNGAWLQVEFAAGPDGKGWINAAFAQARGVENLPIITESGVVVGTGTPTGIPLTPTVTLIPAPADDDSAENPVASITLSATGTKTFLYSGDVSSPGGDTDDWVKFIPYTQVISLDLICRGAEDLIVEILQNNKVQQNVLCGASEFVTTLPGVIYTIHLHSSSTEGLQYTGYTLRVTSLP